MTSLPPAAAITPSRLAAFAPYCKNAVRIAPALDAACAAYQINTPARVRDFLGEVYVESWGFTRLEEDLDYAHAEVIAKTFPARLPTASLAAAYVHQPEKLANLVYGYRFGNEQPGDGWKYRGRGWIGITFKDGYRAMSPVARVDLVADPDQLATPEIASRCAAAWWTHHNLNRLADLGDIDRISRVINGGGNGLQDREAAVKRAAAIWRG